MKLEAVRSGRWLLVPLLVTALAGAVAGCGGDDDGGGGGDGGGDGGSADGGGDKTYRIGLVLPALSNPFISPIRDGAEEAAEELGVDLLVTGTDEPTEQANALQQYLTSANVDALIFNSIDSKAVSPAVEAANQQDVPVIGVVSGTETGELASFVTPDWFQAGEMVGEEIATGWCADIDPCRVGLVAGANAPGAGLDSGKGMIKGIESAPNVELVQTVYTDYSAEQALNAGTEILTGNPDLNFLASWWSVGSLSALEAVRAADKVGDIGVNSLTGACPVLAEMLKDTVYTDVMMFPELMGRTALESAVKILDGEDVPAEQGSPMHLVTNEDVKAMLAGDEEPPDDVPALEHIEEAEAGCNQ